MNREQAIAIIEQLYPADSQYPKSRAIGIALLQQAKAETWRDESDTVLARYVELCKALERKEGRA